MPNRLADRRPFETLARAFNNGGELAPLVALAAFLNFWNLNQNRWANTYYSAGIRSMTLNWHNFFFNSYDPSGVMTIDKTPLSTWIQALSARLFGFGPTSILTPQALIGVATVVLVWDLTRRRWGRPAAFVAGLVLALTPIAVAMSRHNNPDALLTFCVVGALWFTVRGLEDSRTRWIVLTGLAIGLGFETKMASALVATPALALAWVWVAPRGRKLAVAQLAGGGAVMAAVACAWPVAVALTPPLDRPWISGTSDDSIWSLIFGYNGIGRIAGQAGGPRSLADVSHARVAVAEATWQRVFGGNAGPFRLVNAYLGGQIGWLIGAAVFGSLAILAICRLRREDPRTGWLIATGGTFASAALVFSSARGIFHPYYTSLLAPFVAALTGAAIGESLKHGERSSRAVGAAAIGGGAVTELAVWHSAANLPWLPVATAVAAVAAVALLTRGASTTWRWTAAATGIAVLLAAPATWSLQTLGHPTAAVFPLGGPRSAMFGRHQPKHHTAATKRRRARSRATASNTGGDASIRAASNDKQQIVVPALIRYAHLHGGGTVAVADQLNGAFAIIRRASPIAGLGGFSGLESEVNSRWLAGMVDAGRVRWVYTDVYGVRGFQGRIGSSLVMAEVRQACRRVAMSPPWSIKVAPSVVRRRRRSLVYVNTALYDCKGQAPRLRAAAQRTTTLPVLSISPGRRGNQIVGYMRIPPQTRV